MPIKYVFGIKAHSTRETRQKQSNTNTNKPDKKQRGQERKSASEVTVEPQLPSVEIKERESE